MATVEEIESEDLMHRTKTKQTVKTKRKRSVDGGGRQGEEANSNQKKTSNEETLFKNHPSYLLHHRLSLNVSTVRKMS